MATAYLDPVGNRDDLEFTWGTSAATSDTFAEMLAQGVRQPAVPSTADPYARTNGNSDQRADIWFTLATLSGATSVPQIKVWVYCGIEVLDETDPPVSIYVRLALPGGLTDPVTLVDSATPGPPGWYAATFDGPLTQDDVNATQVILGFDNFNGFNDYANAYALYAEVTYSGSGAYSLTAGTGTVGVTGMAAALLYGRVVAAARGTFTTVRYPAHLLYGRRLGADTGTASVAGVGAGLLDNRVLAAATGQFQVVRYSAQLISSQVFGPGSFFLTGSDANLTVARVLKADPGTFTVTTYPTTTAYSLVASAGAIHVLGYPATLRVGLLGPTGLTVDGQDAMAGNPIVASTDTPVLAWNPQAGGAYTVQVARSAGFDGGGVAVTFSGVSTTTVTINPNVRPGGQMYWRVKAGSAGPWSQIGRFRVNRPPRAPGGLTAGT